jgi:tetratricopeptide (TPR) repeat protein
MKQRLFSVLVLLGTLLVYRTAHAQDESLNRARESFDKAQGQYARGEFKEARESFQAAYDARPFAQFLFNIGACHEKLREYDKAVEYYERYLKDEPNAKDKKDVAKRIEVLKKEAEKLKAAPPDPAKPPEEPSKEVVALGEAKIRGLVVIESEPPGAYIYLDSMKNKPLAKTPWNGTLEGEHTIFIDRQGYKPVERRFQPDPNQVYALVFTLAEDDYLGWVEIKSNVPGAEIYVDDRNIGVYNKTPFSGNMKPGKHKLWITAEGYDVYETELDVVQGKTHEINATLKGSPVGYLNIRGTEIELATIYVDGKVLCERGPCRKALTEGTHTIEVKRGGHKTYKRKLEVQPKTETIVRVDMAKKPGRGDAVWAYIFSAVFIGGGVYAGLQANSIHDELNEEIAAGNPPPDSNDPRYFRGKLFAIGADVGYALGGIALLTAVYYTVRDKGPPSTASSDVRAVALEPQLGPGYAGIGMGVSW